MRQPGGKSAIKTPGVMIRGLISHTVSYFASRRIRLANPATAIIANIPIVGSGTRTRVVVGVDGEFQVLGQRASRGVGADVAGQEQASGRSFFEEFQPN